MVKPANFGFLQFRAAPFHSVGFGERLDDRDRLFARGDAPLLQFDKCRAGRVASRIGVLKNAELAAAGGVVIVVAIAVGFRGRPLSRFARAESSEDLFNNFADKIFVECC